MQQFPIFPLPFRLRLAALLALTTVLAGCGEGTLDWDLRNSGQGLNTTDAVLGVTEDRPTTDARGVLSYPGYQVAVAQRGDTVGSVAARIGLPADALARHNALRPDDSLRAGEVLALPQRVAEAGGAFGAPVGSQAFGAAGVQPVDVTTIATTALDRVGAPSGPSGSVAASPGAQPAQHRVSRGETAFSIARTYNVSARSLADWNGLGPDLAVREGQVLLIPVAGAQARTAAVETVQPGIGSPTPLPPSASKPLPQEQTAPAAETDRSAPASPDLGARQTAASASRFLLPVEGKIIRTYVKKKNDGIDIAANPGATVKAADAGTVAAITTDTKQVPIVVLRHEGDLLTVYAGLDGIKVKKGDSVKRGQAIAVVRSADPAFLHFEVRKGVESTDPMQYLQ